METQLPENGQLIVSIISIISGLIGMPIIQFFKSELGLRDKSALYLAMGISIVLGVISVVLGGIIDPAMPITAETALKAIALSFSFATVFYKLLLGDKKIG